MLTSNRTIIGILAHVDAGKTTLTESVLYHTGTIRSQGSVDHRNTCLDFEEIERDRKITVFAKQADFVIDQRHFTLIDTPGHADLSAEMERALRMLDVAVLVVSAVDGVQAHTETIFRLLEEYSVPTIIFINKNDRPDTSLARSMADLQRLDSRCMAWQGQFEERSSQPGDAFIEQLANLNDAWIEDWIEERIDNARWIERAAEAVMQRALLPCIWGAAVTGSGLNDLLWVLKHFTHPVQYPETSGARIYKIFHDAKGHRHTLLKITGGSLKVKERVWYPECAPAGDKISQLMRIDGHRSYPILEANAGDICLVTGIQSAVPGMYISGDPAQTASLKEWQPLQSQPVVEAELLLPEGIVTRMVMQDLRLIEAEEPELALRISPTSGNVLMRVMGTIHMEVLANKIQQRLGIQTTFGPCSILYQETVTRSMTGYGHYEPLGHYAEVKLRIDPGKPGQGVVAKSECGINALPDRYQNLIRAHIEDEKDHRGVLTGSPLTDVDIVLLTACYTLTDTNGGDIRQATYRAIRQALMKAENQLLEPWYRFSIGVPFDYIGRTLSEIQRRFGQADTMVTGDDGWTTMTGSGPVATFLDFPVVLASFSKGRGSIMLKVKGYLPCHNADEVIARLAYQPEADLENTPNSILFSKGAGFEVKWHEVDNYHNL